MKFPSIFAGILGLLLSVSAPAAIVIQEVLYDGPGSDSDDVFTELYGLPGTSLDGFSLVGVNGADGMAYRTIDLTGLIIPPDGLFVIATSSAASSLAGERDFIANVDWQNGPDAIQLREGSSIVDALQYGDAGPFNAGEGMFAVDVTGAIALSRDLFGTDTDDNAADFAALAPTPGSGPAVVPVPAAVWLFGSGLGLLGLVRRKAKQPVQA